MAAHDGAWLDEPFAHQGKPIRRVAGGARRHTCRAHVDGPQILTDEISAIPDVVVSCAPIDHSTPMIAQPALIAEVMSPSSEGDDTTRKWFTYRKIPSLRHYLVLSQEKREVQVHSRAGDLWHERFVAEGALELDDPPLRLELADLYAETDIAA
jgi:Uma2 family endonuclease